MSSVLIPGRFSNCARKPAELFFGYSLVGAKVDWNSGLASNFFFDMTAARNSEMDRIGDRALSTWDLSSVVMEEVFFGEEMALSSLLRRLRFWEMWRCFPKSCSSLEELMMGVIVSSRRTMAWFSRLILSTTSRLTLSFLLGALTWTSLRRDSLKIYKILWNMYSINFIYRTLVMFSMSFLFSMVINCFRSSSNCVFFARVLINFYIR